jgi:TPR repeat protein
MQAMHGLNLQKGADNCIAKRTMSLQSSGFAKRKAADQGFAAAQYALGSMYNKGWGVAKSPSLALEWWRKAAMQGFAFAQCSLGERYSSGMGVEKNYRLAAKWHRKAAE